MTRPRKIRCPECGEMTEVNRREFIKGVSAAALGASAGVVPVFATPRLALAGDQVKSTPETAVKRLYDSLSDKQKSVICKPFDDPLRQKYGANWAITKPTISDFFTKDQQETIREIFRGCTSEDGYARFLKQMDEDYGGFGQYHVAIFGKPGKEGQFQFVMTGRHMTIRDDGNFSDGTAFGGPMVYGHGTGDSQKGLPGNVFYYQTLKANEVFKMLDGKQQKVALLDKAPREDAVQIRGPRAQFPGIALSELSADQKKLVEQVMHELLAPYRPEDVKEAMGCLKAGGGLDQMHLAFYKDQDIGSDEIWDIWRLEGPTFVWHFRGAPHVHTYVNIASTGKEQNS
jgi:Protein of unknown function (DUF3500)